MSAIPCRGIESQNMERGRDATLNFGNICVTDAVQAGPLRVSNLSDRNSGRNQTIKRSRIGLPIRNQWPYSISVISPAGNTEVSFILHKTWLRRTQAGPGRAGKQQQEQTSPNLERRIKEISVVAHIFANQQSVKLQPNCWLCS